MNIVSGPRARLALLCALPAWVLGAALPAQAQNTGASEDNTTVTVGGGIAYGPSYEGSDDYRIIPAAIVRGKVSGHNFYTRGLSLYVDALSESADEKLDLSFGPAIGVRLSRVSGIKDAQVRALGKLDAAIEVGAFAGIAKTGVITSDYDTLAFRVSYLTDVGGAHKSYIVSPSIEYGTPLSRTTYVGLSVSADYVGDRYASYYFDVTPAGSAASGLTPFDADGGFKNVSFGLMGAQSLSGDVRKGWSLFAVGSYSKLLGDFKRSPIVSEAGDRNQWFGALGVGYTF